MARTKSKEYKAITIRMDTAVYEQLEEFCGDSGQSKTVAIERAITAYTALYRHQKEILAEAEKNNR